MDHTAPASPLQSLYQPDASLDERAAIDLCATAGGHHVLVMQVSGAEGWAVLVALQLACRHPEFQNNPARWLAEQFAHQIQAAVATTPALRDFAEREWNQIREENALRGLRCRVCGCTDQDCHQCIAKTGKPCYWVEHDLCSACATPAYLADRFVEEGAPK